MTTSPRPAFLVPLRLEIWHDDNSAKIRWYPDDCHIVPEKEKKQGKENFDHSLENFLGKGYELKTFPHKVSLYTVKGGKVTPLVDGKNINDDEALNDLKEIAKDYSQNIKIEIKDFLLNLSCRNMYSETRDEILSKVESSQEIYQELFKKYEEEVTNHVHINVPDRRFYNELKTYAKRYNIGWLQFNDRTCTVQLLRVVSKKEINKLQRYLPQDWLASFRQMYESVSYSKTVYGVLHPRIGDPALPANKWMTDFYIAEASGMAVTLEGKIFRQLKDAEWLIATGLRDEEDNLLEDIFRSHIKAGNLKILKQGEPTNNTRQEKVAPIKMQKPKEGKRPLPAANANLLSRHLGVKPKTFAGADDSSSRDENIVEVIKHLFWPICSVNYFNQIYQKCDDEQKANGLELFKKTQNQFLRYVNPRGHLPAIRIGENPYGFVLTATKSECEKSPFFKTFGMDLHTLRQKLLDIANGHGRFMNTEGVSIEEMYDELDPSNTQNKRNFHDYVLSKHKPVYSKNESDFERLENILRQNAVSNRLDLENDTESVSVDGLPGGRILVHRRSSDALLLKSGETEKVVIEFLEKLKNQLKANAFVLSLLLVSRDDVENLFRYFNEAIKSLNGFIQYSLVGGHYFGQEWENHKTTLGKIKYLILQLKSLNLPEDLSLVAELVTKIQSAFSALPKIEKLSAQEDEMLNYLEGLTSFCQELESTGSSIKTKTRKIRRMQERNENTAKAFIAKNPGDSNRLDNTIKEFVQTEFKNQNEELVHNEKPFSEAKEATNNITSNFSRVKNGLKASTILSALSPITRSVQSIETDLTGGTVNSETINAKISSLDISGFSVAEEKLESLVVIKDEISTSWSSLIQNKELLEGNGESIAIKKWFTGYLKSLEKIKNVLELSLAWKESMPILRRMLVLSIIYACRGGYIDKDYSRAMRDDLELIIEWLKSDQLKIRDLETMIMQVLDCFSSRMDAWITAEVAEILNQPENKGGRTLGVYGFLENPISQKQPKPPEFFQAPSLDQAKTTAILRAGSLTDEKAFQINLTGERINQAVWFIEGLQKGYSPAELLGRYAERLVHDESIDVVLLPLRKRFPLYVRIDDSSPGFMNIIDGEKFEACTDQDICQALKDIQGVDSDDIQKTKGIRQQTKSLRDAVADLSIAETVYQQITGNTAGAQAWLEAAEGKAIPPFPQVVRTPHTGYSKVQRILFPIKAIETLDKMEGRTPREISEPSLAEYLESALRGYRNLKIKITVTETGDPETVLDTAEISFSALGISAFDLVVGGKSLIINCARIKYWLNQLEQDQKDYGDIVPKNPDEFFDGHEFRFSFSDRGEEIIKFAAQVQGLLRAVSPIEPSDLDIVPKDDAMKPPDKQRQDVLDQVSILEKKISMCQCLNSRNAQLRTRIQSLLESPIKTDIDVQKFLLQAILWSIKNTEYPITVTGEKKEESEKVLKGITDKLKSLGKECKEQEDKINSDIGKIRDDLKSGKHLDWGEIQMQLDKDLSDLSSKLKTFSGGEGMIILPPIQAPYKLDANNVKDAEGDLRELKFVRKNMKLFFQYLDKMNNIDMPKYKTYKYPFKSWEEVVNQALVTLNPDQSKDLSNIEITPSKESWKTSSADLHFFSCSERALEPVTNGALFTGLKIDEWTDFIPKNQETTGIAFNCDIPQSEAPNCFLLCAPSKISEPTPGSLNWKLDDLADAIANVIDLMRIRTLTTDDILADPALQKYLPTLRYSREYASDFPLELQMELMESTTFMSTSDFLHQDIPSVSAYYDKEST